MYRLTNLVIAIILDEFGHSSDINGVVSRHIETIVLLCRKAEQADRHIAVNYEPQGRHMEKR